MINKLVLIILNLGLVFILLFMQFLMFGFLPSISPHLSKIDQRTEAMRFVLSKDLILLLEASVGLVILYVINKKMNYNRRLIVWIFVIELFILLAFIIFFSIDYVNKFPT